MSLRNQLKMPKYGLFYFESDKSTSIVPTKKITHVVKGDKSLAKLIQIKFVFCAARIKRNENSLKLIEIKFVFCAARIKRNENQ